MKTNLTSMLLALTLGGLTDLGYGGVAGQADVQNTTLSVVAQSSTTLSAEEQKGLLWMREEEKLARDVYNVLAKKWGNPFSNIAKSEQTHMDAVKTLLTRYEIPDPAATTKPGEFKDPSLQKLHDEFVKTGSISRAKALQVGAEIEDLDLFDLERWLKVTKGNDVKQVYGNLERGSRNHLRAFVSNLKASGGTYTPKYISRATFDKIIAAPMERGGGMGRGRNPGL